MNDLETLDLFCETSLDIHINPALVRIIGKKNLLWTIEMLPNNEFQAKAMVRERIIDNCKKWGDPEIDKMVNEVSRLEQLREKLVNVALKKFKVKVGH